MTIVGHAEPRNHPRGASGALENALRTGLLLLGLFVLLIAEIPSEPSDRELPHVVPAASTTLNGLSFEDGLWLHRVNTITRAREGLDLFSGIEIDVVFEEGEGRFDVRHRDVESIGLCLERYFEELDADLRPYYWLDLKNLDETHAAAQLARLEELATRYDLMDRLLVESSNPNELAAFTRAGFRTSLYVPQIDPRTASADEIVEWVSVVSGMIGSGRVNALSADYSLHGLIENYFPGSERLFWAPELRLERKRDRDQMEKILADPRTKVLLVGHRTLSPWR